MSIYLNARFEDGERLSVEIASNKGWVDFARWARSRTSARVKKLGQAEAEGSVELRNELRQEIEAAAPSPSALAVAQRLIDVLPHEGELSVSDEPDDSEEG